MVDPLHTLHEQANAEFQSYGAVPIVSTFGVPQAEYAAIHKACGLMDLPQRGVIELTGKDRLTFLNNLLTNQIVDKQTKTPIAAGSGLYAFLLNAKNGRIVVDMNVLELGERALLEMDGRLIEAVLPMLEKYRFAEQVQIASRQNELHEIAIHGPGAINILKETCDGMPALDAPLSCGTARILGHDVVVWRDDPCGVPGLHLILTAQAAEAIWSHFIARFAGNLSKPGLAPSPLAAAAEIAGWKGWGEGKEFPFSGSDASGKTAAESLPFPNSDTFGKSALSLPILSSDISRNVSLTPHPNPSTPRSPRQLQGERGQEGKRQLRPIGWAAFNACRIEAGRPIFGIDFDDSVLPAETGQLARAVSFTKGCYPGQEVVARMHARQQVARQIVGLKMESDALPIAGAQIFDDNGNAVGGVTSSTISPILSNAALCIGLVKKPFFAVGTKLTIPAEGAMQKATVVETPFKRE